MAKSIRPDGGQPLEIASQRDLPRSRPKVIWPDGPIGHQPIVAPDVDGRFRRVVLDDIARRGPIFQAMKQALGL